MVIETSRNIASRASSFLPCEFVLQMSCGKHVSISWRFGWNHEFEVLLEKRILRRDVIFLHPSIAMSHTFAFILWVWTYSPKERQKLFRPEASVSVALAAFPRASYSPGPFLSHVRRREYSVGMLDLFNPSTFPASQSETSYIILVFGGSPSASFFQRREGEWDQEELELHLQGFC